MDEIPTFFIETAEIRDAAASVKDLSVCIRELPKQISAELHAVDRAFQSGLMLGVTLSLLVVVSVSWLKSWWKVKP